jgi:hypothetical protein
VEKIGLTLLWVPRFIIPAEEGANRRRVIHPPKKQGWKLELPTATTTEFEFHPFPPSAGEKGEKGGKGREEGREGREERERKGKGGGKGRGKGGKERKGGGGERDEGANRVCSSHLFSSGACDKAALDDEVTVA